MLQHKKYIFMFVIAAFLFTSESCSVQDKSVPLTSQSSFKSPQSSISQTNQPTTSPPITFLDPTPTVSPSPTVAKKPNPLPALDQPFCIRRIDGDQTVYADSSTHKDVFTSEPDNPNGLAYWRDIKVGEPTYPLQRTNSRTYTPEYAGAATYAPFTFHQVIDVSVPFNNGTNIPQADWLDWHDYIARHPETTDESLSSSLSNYKDNWRPFIQGAPKCA